MRGNHLPLLSIIVPVYNEARHIKDLLPQLFNSECPLPRQWILVDDGSSDGTFDILKDLQKDFSFVLKNHYVNRGKGAAIKTGIKESHGDFILIQDADFEYDPKDIPSLLAPLLENKADAVYGSRFLNRQNTVHWAHRGVNLFLTKFNNLVTGLNLTDMETGYKVFHGSFLRERAMMTNRFGIEVEMTAEAAKASLRVVEVPISYAPRSYLEGKKISWRDGVAALWHIIYFNFLKKSQ